MVSLTYPELFHLSAALGWYELGNLVEATAELDKIRAPFNLHPDVLEMRWVLESARKDWNQAFTTADKLVEVSPDRSSAWLHRAYAGRRMAGGGVALARNLLEPALHRFPSEPTIPYNLACYACQMGDLEEARKYLRTAFAVGGHQTIKTMTLQDVDLQPLWAEVQQWPETSSK